MTQTQQHIFNQEIVNRRLGMQHQINLQGKRKGAPTTMQKRKRSKSKSNLTILKQINGTQEITDQL